MDVNNDQSKWKRTCSKFFIFPQRYVFGLMGFFAIFNAYTMRTCLSVVITQLVVPRNYSKETLERQFVCPILEMRNRQFLPGGEFEWSQELQGYILSSFYVGYLLTHIPGGILAQQFGGKWILIFGILSTACFTLATPWCTVNFEAYGLICLRILMGLGEGTTFPALSCLIAQWVPMTERSLIGALVLGGGQVGAIVGNTISGFVLKHFRWELVFYIFGSVALLWCILFALLCYSDPASHPFIKKEEKDYLLAEMGSIARRHDLPPTPWGSIFSTCSIYALICSQIGHDWGFYIIATDLPKYLNDVIQMPIEKNGFYSSLPFGVMWICSVFSGFLSDVIIKNGAVNITTIRKFNTLLSGLGSSVFVILASYAGCHRFLVLTSFTIGMGLMGPYFAGMKLTPIDMSRNYCGIIMAISNGFGCFTGIIAPSTVGLMTPNTTMREWRLVFWIAFFILVASGIIFAIWATGERQEWDEPDKVQK
ncbi:putative inorganic phosphate cotransporter [Teleopsis dalmanni]|uniref:putative inorganic phosphate cotransporter n=1 Tax=Teleopsis dalmanni TaxID=139649 RepID=UPI0018CEA5CF|nr:putative inorganic phosphate cotransporter [Teleopsis dalmanni]